MSASEDHVSEPLTPERDVAYYLNGLLDILKDDLTRADAATQAIVTIRGRLSHGDGTDVEFGETELAEDMRRVMRVHTMSLFIDLFGVGAYKGEIMSLVIRGQFGGGHHSQFDDEISMLGGLLRDIKNAVGGLSNSMGALRTLSRMVERASFKPAQDEKRAIGKRERRERSASPPAVPDRDDR